MSRNYGKYQEYEGLVKSSVAWVANAGKTKNPLVIAMEKCRHHDLMTSIRRKLGL